MLYHFDRIKLSKSLVGEVVFKKINKRSSKILNSRSPTIRATDVIRFSGHASSHTSPKRLINITKSRVNLNFLFTITSFVHIWVCRPLTSQRVRERRAEHSPEFHNSPLLQAIPLALLSYFASLLKQSKRTTYANSFLFTFAPNNSQHKHSEDTPRKICKHYPYIISTSPHVVSATSILKRDFTLKVIRNMFTIW